MGLQYTVDKLDGLDEGVAAFYKEADGKYVLDVEGVVPESKFNEVNQKAVDNATEAVRRRKTVERITAKLGLDSADGLDEALDGLLNTKAKPNADHEAIIAQMKKQHGEELSAAKGQIKAIVGNAAKSELKAALAAARFHPEIVDDITVTAMSRVSVDDDGNVRIMSADGKPLAGSGAEGYATFADLAKELAAAKPSFLVDGGKGGGGKSPASGSGSSGSKTVTRSQFDTMSHAERADFSKQGGKVVDG